MQTFETVHFLDHDLNNLPLDEIEELNKKIREVVEFWSNGENYYFGYIYTDGHILYAYDKMIAYLGARDANKFWINTHTKSLTEINIINTIFSVMYGDNSPFILDDCFHSDSDINNYGERLYCHHPETGEKNSWSPVTSYYGFMQWRLNKGDRKWQASR